MSKTHALTAAQIGVNGALVQWLLGHSEAIGPIMTSVQTILDGSVTIYARIQAIKALVDTLAGIAADMPGIDPATATPATSEVVNAINVHAKIGDGTILKGLLGLLSNPQFISTLLTIIGLFGGKPPVLPAAHGPTLAVAQEDEDEAQPTASKAKK